MDFPEILTYLLDFAILFVPGLLFMLLDLPEMVFKHIISCQFISEVNLLAKLDHIVDV